MLWLVFEWTISVGEFFTLLFYSFLLFNPLYELPTVATNFQELKASNEILDEIFKLPVVEVPEWAKSISEIQSISYEWVTFGYNDEELALQNITLQAKQWETIAFVGPSWAWKSTILKLLTWLYSPNTWSLKVNKTDTKTLDRNSIKSHIGIVAQETQLFSWTIYDNLQFVAPWVTEDECWTALDQAQLGTFVRNAPNGLQSTIWEWWLKLSGWQKQRLAIARALLRDPDLLIFDEATSSLDSLVEAKITETITNISKDNHNLITVLVAHRLSTIMHADRIYVLEAWQIVEQWSHDALVQEKGLYYALWRQQGGR
jgi:ATP-binding cassette subfamily B protein